MAAPMDVNSVRKSLTEKLGDSSTIYFQNLASWFKKKTSKEDFDLEARRLLPSDAVHLHNEFLLAIISKCQSISSSMAMSKEAALQSASTSSATSAPASSATSSSAAARLQQQKSNRPVKRKQPSTHRSHSQRFVPVNPVDYVPQVSCKSLEEGSTPIGFSSQNLLLPDSALIHGRALVCAWETGLQDVQDSVVSVIIHALEVQLKRILTAVMQKRSGYKVREKRFLFAMGCGVRNPYLRQSCITNDPSQYSEPTTVTNAGYHTPSLKPSLAVAQQQAAHEMALVDQPPTYRAPISMFDLLQALQVFDNPEDVARFGGKVITHPMVERIRRCHQNDLESVLPFTLIGLLYVSAEPDPDKALRIFQVYAASRMLHTAAYLIPLPQPARVLSFYVGWGATGLMTFFLFARLTFFK